MSAIPRVRRPQHSVEGGGRLPAEGTTLYLRHERVGLRSRKARATSGTSPFGMTTTPTRGQLLRRIEEIERPLRQIKEAVRQMP